MAPVAGLGKDTKAAINVYFVWDLKDNTGTPYYGYTNNIPGTYFLIANGAGILGITGAHEAGHVFGLSHDGTTQNPNSWSKDLMYTPASGNSDQIIIHKFEADIANGITPPTP